MKVLAIDPSLTCTGWAVVGEPRAGRPGPAGVGALVAAGRIRPEGEDLPARARDLYGAVRALVATHRPDRLVVELPAARGIPPSAQGFASRSALTLPTYGLAVGVCLAAGWTSRAKVLGVAADEWTRGLPGTRGDPKKGGRVRLVETLWRLAAGALGPVTTAGNVADAVLLGDRMRARLIDHAATAAGGPA